MSQYESKLVFLDLDDMTLDLRGSIIPFNNKFFGITITPEQYAGNWRNTPWASNYNSQEEYDVMIKNEWWPSVIKAGLYENVRAMPDARPVLLRLQKCGVPFAAITSRPEKIQNATMVCLERELADIQLQDVVFMGDRGHGAPKGEVVAQMGGVMLMDDVYDQIKSATDCRVMGLLFGNAPDVIDVQADEGNLLYRAKNWLDAESTILQMLGNAV